MKTILFLASLMASSTYASVISGYAHDNIKFPSSSVATIRGPNEPSGIVNIADEMSKRSWETYCHIANHKPSQKQSIQELRNWLYNLATNMDIEGGPDKGKCDVKACKHNTAVWVCSDTMAINSVNSIAIAYRIDAIVGDKNCATDGDVNLIQGQSFGDSGYNVIVGEDPCAGGEIPKEEIHCDDNGCY